MTSMFDKAYNNSFHNSTFVTNVKAAPSLDKLFARVAPNAILNGGGRADEPRCHPGTREAVIGHIEVWSSGQVDSTAPILWLSGPAGAGKSAIVQTIAERCDERGVPHANFFFFRADSSRSQVSPLVATLVYQVIYLYPSLRDLIATLLHYNPPIIDVALKDQLVQLIVAPLRSIQQSTPTYRPVLFLIDGLDECDSEAKLGQQQILQAFDAIFMEHSEPFPFRLLVGSRTEPQIQTAFNKLSSPCLNIYLDDKYSPENDIRKFVNDQFQLIKETHPLRHTLNATWPFIEDVNYIVDKSSGQFIFAATTVRFISESSAAPTISLDKIKGAARHATKSPFSHVDALYTYILLQVDDQDALKDILTAQLFLNQTSSSLPTGQLLEVYNRKYTETVVVSCLADLTPIAWYTDYKLKFHHASFPDFLSDLLRSSGYFVDITAFAYNVLPVICKYLDASSDYRNFVKSAVTRLERPPPGLLATLALSNSFIDSINVSDTALFGKFNQLCISDDNIANFRNLCRQWIKRRIDHFKLKENRKDVEDIPFGSRYYQMALAERFLGAPDNIMDTLNQDDIIAAAALIVESNFDRHESALWFKDLLHDIHRKKYPSNAEGYRKLVKAWIFWAGRSGLPLNGPADEPNNAASNDTERFVDIPYSRRYFAMVRIDCDHTILPIGHIATSLSPESDFDREESALWLEELLHNIHKEKYTSDIEGYRKLVKAWIFWANQSGLPLDGPSDGVKKASNAIRRSIKIPHSRRYFAMVRVGRDHKILPSDPIATSLTPESDFDRKESALWLEELLRNIYKEKYPSDSEGYRELVRAWISWAVWNGVPCDRLTPLSDVQWYIWQNTAQKLVTDALKSHRRDFLIFFCVSFCFVLFSFLFRQSNPTGAPSSKGS